jgi:hypothetical protein
MDSQYQIHFKIMGIWCGIVTPDQVTTLEAGVKSLTKAQTVCERHAGSKLDWHSINGHFTGVKA